MKSNSSPPFAFSIIIKSSLSVSIIFNQVSVVFSYFVKLDYVRVSNLLEDFYFSCDSFYVLLVVDFFFFEDLDRDLKEFYFDQRLPFHLLEYVSLV